MKAFDKNVVVGALGEMASELATTKQRVEKFAEDLSAMKPEDMDFSFGKEAPEEGKAEEPVEGAEPNMEESGKEEAKEKLPKTKEEAKKMLEEACKDVQAVVDGLDGILGQAEQEKESAQIKRPNEKYASTLNDLRKNAEIAIEDANSALRHWAFLKKAYRPQEKIAELTHTDLKQVANTLEQVSALEKVMDKLGFVRKSKVVNATAVPPTGAEFSGDKLPAGKNIAEVEIRHWEAGATEFDKNIAKENKLPNPAVDERLTDAGNPHDEKPYVNASLYIPEDNKFGAYWNVEDTKSGKNFKAAFINIPASLGPKDEKSFAVFASKQYGERIATRVIQSGIDEVATSMGGKFVKTADLQNEARNPKIKDKAKVRKYFADAFGDKAYARELTSSEKGADGSKMNVEYTPADEHPEAKNNEKTKDGPGKISAQEPTAEEKQLIRARAERSVELAKVLASRGGILFVKTAVLAQAGKYMKMDDATFSATAAALESLPIVNESALREAHIPDTEKGIVGNKSEGVRQPSAKVKTEDINSTVKADANISKSASLVPQTVSDSEGKNDISSLFSTTASRLEKKGISITKLRRPTYSQRSGQ
jgi:hypothetical protein